MASLRKRYVDRIEAGPSQDEPPVSVPPTGAAKLPDEPGADVKPPPEMLEVESPVAKAEKDAIALQLRLKEMERAEQFNREAARQPPQQPQEPPSQDPPSQDPLEAFLASVPEATANWLRAHPEYMTDQRKNAALQHFHWTARDEAGEEFTPRYIERLEHHLGLRPRSNGVPKQNAATPAPRYEAPPRQQQRTPVAYSAPPTREAPSMTTGRMPSAPVRLTAEQKELCRSLGLSEAQYAEELRKMEAMKQSGQII
jgi:hypothetical protein